MLQITSINILAMLTLGWGVQVQVYLPPGRAQSRAKYQIFGGKLLFADKLDIAVWVGSWWAVLKLFWMLDTSLTVLQDSLTADDFHWSPGLAVVNKNNYTLTYSGHGSVSGQAEHASSPHRLQLSESKYKQQQSPGR